MSFDLGFWPDRLTATNKDAAIRYKQLVHESLTGSDATEPLLGFLRDVQAVYPDLTVETMETSPWSSPIYVSAEGVVVSISGSRAPEVGPVLWRLAAQHGLTCFDPQRSEVVT